MRTHHPWLVKLRLADDFWGERGDAETAEKRAHILDCRFDVRFGALLLHGAAFPQVEAREYDLCSLIQVGFTSGDEL